MRVDAAWLALARAAAIGTPGGQIGRGRRRASTARAALPRPMLGWRA
jgi:hypothetical protein